MASYTVTITPDTGVGAQAAVKVDVDRGHVRIIELVVRPQGGRSRHGSSSDNGRLSAESFDLILRAVRPALTAVDAMQQGGAGATESVMSRSQRRVREPGPARTSRRRESGAEQSRAGTLGGRPRSAARVAGEARQPGKAQPGGRAYRRTPDDLAESLARIGSVTALAAHYGVPRHTAQGWVGRLRRD